MPPLSCDPLTVWYTRFSQALYEASEAGLLVTVPAGGESNEPADTRKHNNTRGESSPPIIPGGM